MFQCFKPEKNQRIIIFCFHLLWQKKTLLFHSLPFHSFLFFSDFCFSRQFSRVFRISSQLRRRRRQRRDESMDWPRSATVAGRSRPNQFVVGRLGAEGLAVHAYNGDFGAFATRRNSSKCNPGMRKGIRPHPGMRKGILTHPGRRRM